MVYIALEDPGSNPTKMLMVKCVNNRNAHVLALRDWRKYIPLIYTGPATLLRYYLMTLWFTQNVSDFVNTRGKLVQIVLLLVLIEEAVPLRCPRHKAEAGTKKLPTILTILTRTRLVLELD